MTIFRSDAEREEWYTQRAFERECVAASRRFAEREFCRLTEILQVPLVITTAGEHNWVEDHFLESPKRGA